MFLFDLWYNFLSFLGALGICQKRATILFVGLENAGKTTLFHILKDDRVAIHCPTYNPIMGELVFGMRAYKIYDMGGTLYARRMWREYYTSGVVDGVVFVVDAEDSRRFLEAKNELDALLSCNALTKVPFLVIGNKIDLKAAVSEEELRYQLGLDDVTRGNDEHSPLIMSRKKSTSSRPIGVFMCSVMQKSSYSDGFKWLSQLLK